ncbi:thiol-activated cytolysin family protein [uncultured Aquimarina sp.]|uniref:thiol-activated cytolysin family protein n=1 Tax=uncultured Aquimarina sp. TaxID=575652 RepID=UPI00260378C0|nr:thiol-activated cytolysin family protein [uncultured Aquimarina sp.]
MKKLSRSFINFSVLILLCLALGCSNDDSVNSEDPNVGGEPLTYDDVFSIGNEIPSFNEERIENIVSVEEAPLDEDNADGTTSRFICVTETVNLRDGTGKFNLFDTNAEVIFPGNLLQGSTLSEPTPSPIVVERAGGTISININNGNLQSSAEVDEVKRSTIQDAINQIISTSGEEAPANFTVDIEQVESEEQLAVELGINVRAFRVNVSSNFSFSTEKEFNRTLVKLDQSMYTMSFDLPTDIGQIFDESVTPEDLAPFVQPDNPATFISSVTFGRVFYMLIESTSTRQEMDASINASFSGLAVNASASLDVSSVESLSDLKIKVIAYGGPSSGAFELIGETNIRDIASALGQTSDLRFALPISYVVRSVERPDQIVGVNLATEFGRTTCELKGQLPLRAYRNLVDIFGAEDRIGAAFNIDGAVIGVYNDAGDRYAIYDAGLGEVLGIFDHNDPDGPLGVSNLDNVGAGFKHTETDKGFPENTVVLTDKGGIRSHRFFVNDNFDINDANLIGVYASNTESIETILSTNSSPFPFSAEGISAAAGLPSNLADGNRMTSIIFSGGSPEFMQNLFSSSTAMSNVATQNLSVLLKEEGNDSFNKIRAAAVIRFLGGEEELLLINEEGDLMMYLSDLNARRRDVYRRIREVDNFEAIYSGIRVLK